MTTKIEGTVGITYPDASVQNSAGISQVNADTRYVNVAGDTMTGQLNGITPTAAANLTRKDYVDGQVVTKVSKSGDTMTGNLDVQGRVSSGSTSLGNGISAINSGGRLDFTADGTQTILIGSANSGSPTARWYVGTYNAFGDTAITLTRGNGTERWRMEAGAQGATNSLIFSHDGTPKGEILQSTGVYNPLSSIKFKENVQDSPYGLQSVLAMRPVTFEYKDSHAPAVGFIAEEMQPIIPVSVHVNEAGEVRGIDYNAVVSSLVKATQELSAKIDTALARIAELEAK